MIVSHVRDEMKLLRFTASWCQPCKALAKNLEKANLNIPIEVIDIDENDQKAIEYSIRSVPTLVLIDDGNEKRMIGVKTAEEIKKWVNE
jgi:thioredoxin 1